MFVIEFFGWAFALLSYEVPNIFDRYRPGPSFIKQKRNLRQFSHAFFQVLA